MTVENYPAPEPKPHLSAGNALRLEAAGLPGQWWERGTEALFLSLDTDPNEMPHSAKGWIKATRARAIEILGDAALESPQATPGWF